MQEKVCKEDWKEMPVIKRMAKGKEATWQNPKLEPWEKVKPHLEVTAEDVQDAAEMLERFAPFIEICFPETKDQKGLIESPLREIKNAKAWLNAANGMDGGTSGEQECTDVLKRDSEKVRGRLFLKMDSHLAVAGSVKARGGIYEILKHTEELAFQAGFLKKEDDYRKLARPEYRKYFQDYTVQVGSTGNLGLSIGIASAAVGFQVIVHMSADAKQWKKDMLRAHGVTVVEYESDYSEAVKQGRRLSDENPKSYFVDDENSRDLFLGYAVAAGRLEKQLREQGVAVDENHPLFVYIPCGVGGAPGGVTFGLKECFGDFVHVFFVEPTQAPCMLLGMASGLHNDICVQDIGLSGLTHADGLAVGRPSGFVGKVMEPLLSGEVTVKDRWLYEYMRMLEQTEGIFIEPSACAAFAGVHRLETELKGYIHAHSLEAKMEAASHIVWATGGRLVPEKERKIYRQTRL